MASTEAAVITRTDCDCVRCRSLCKRNPGWPLPAEARAAIEAGHAKRFMRDWLEPDEEVGNEDRILIIAPASEGCGGTDAPEMEPFDFSFTKGQCVFYGKGGCELHTSGFKPLQCRLAYGCRSNRENDAKCPDNIEIGRLWDTDEGRAVVALWEAAVAD